MLHFNGTGWFRVLLGTTSDLSGVWASGGKDVWVVGTKGLILHRRTP
jgi:hypothetical protein